MVLMTISCLLCLLAFVSCRLLRCLEILCFENISVFGILIHMELKQVMVMSYILVYTLAII